jgi:hypothetical protein
MAKIRNAERAFESVSSLEADISLTSGQVSDVQASIIKLEKDIDTANYDQAVRDKGALINQRRVDVTRLNSELATLNLQASSRAKLALNRTALSDKEAEVAAS